MLIGDRVKIVDDVGKENSVLIGKIGTIKGFKWNKFREENNLPVVQLDDGQVISGWSLWFTSLVEKEPIGNVRRVKI